MSKWNAQKASHTHKWVLSCFFCLPINGMNVIILRVENACFKRFICLKNEQAIYYHFPAQKFRFKMLTFLGDMTVDSYGVFTPAFMRHSELKCH